MLRAHILTAASIKGTLSGSFRVKNRALYQGCYKVCVVFLTHVSEMSVQPLEEKKITYFLFNQVSNSHPLNHIQYNMTFLESIQI